jgi:hypothetical protein
MVNDAYVVLSSHIYYKVFQNKNQVGEATYRLNSGSYVAQPPK